MVSYTTSLPVLEVPDDMRQAAVGLVAAKYRIDALLKGHDAAFLNDDLLAHRSTTMDPGTFIRGCFPFLFECRGSYPDFAARMPMAHVIGDSWKWGPEHAMRGEDEAAEEFLLSDDRASPNDPARAEYFWLKEFGVMWGHEGKNRARFLQLRGAETMPAIVTRWGFPPAHEIKRYTVEIYGRKETWAVWLDRWVQRIIFPELSGHLLTLYGVAATERWPRGEPDPKTIAAAMQEDMHHSVIDLQPFRAKAERDREEMRVSMVDLWQKGCVRADLRNFVKPGLAALASAILFILPFHLCKLIAGGAWCSLVGFNLALGHRCFIMRRGRLWP